MVADYIIVGAGTAGLVVANRLSANPKTQVLLIESGEDDRNNPNVTDPLNRNENANTAIDWSYKSTPQPGLNDRKLSFIAGKIVGGTSMINGMQYIRTTVAEIDGWERLGAKGWNWDSLWPFYKDLERFKDPTPEQSESGIEINPEFHGMDGDLAVSYPTQVPTGSLSSTLSTTWESLGVPTRLDANGGRVEGYTVRPMMIDRDSGVRASAAVAFYYPVSNRKNLSLVQGTVSDLEWNDNLEGNTPKVKGVKYRDNEGNLQSIELRDGGEVILAAGALATPAILQASGVGSPSLLNALGIEIRVDLPGVGENLQDQPDLTFSYVAKSPTPGAITPYAAFVTAKDVFGEKKDYIASSTEAKLHDWAETVASTNKHVGTEAIEAIFRHQHDLIFKENLAVGEITMTSSEKIASEYWSLLPFSRGSVRLSSKTEDGTYKVDINPRFLQIEFDQECFAGIGRLVQKFWSTSPAAEIVSGKVEPNDETLPNDATDEQWSSYIKETTGPNHHVLGTAAMMSRELGGVVDENLKVYGVQNVRVVDASVFPMQVTGHLTSTVYAVAARGAHLILSGS